MAMIKCPECGNDISDTADKCIHCGYVLKKKKSFPVGIIIAIACVVVVVGVVAVLFSKGIINFGTKQNDADIQEVAEEEVVEEETSILDEFPELAELFSIDKYPEANKFLRSHMKNSNSGITNTTNQFINYRIAQYNYTGGLYIDKQEINIAGMCYYDTDNQIDHYYISFFTSPERAQKYKEFAIELFGDDYTELYEKNYEYSVYWEDGSMFAIENDSDEEGKRFVIIHKGFCGSQKLGTNKRMKENY